MRPRPLFFEARDAPIERDVIVLARPRDEPVNRGQRDDRVLELLVDEVDVGERRVARDRPADPQRRLSARRALEHRDDRLRRRRSARGSLVVAHADHELLREGAERARELGGQGRLRGRLVAARLLIGAAVGLRRRGEPRAQVVDVHLRVRVHREADLDRLRVDPQR